jgi:hypothetical protein
MTGVSLWLLCTAITLSTVSAYYSIVGLAAIFAASFWPVLILATTLEVGKLVLVSWLYRNWRETPWPIRTYMTVAVIILMGITSLGIFGFLSKAHAEDQVQAQQIQLQVTQILNQIEVRQQQLTESRQVVDQLNRAINIQLDANRAQQALANRRQQTAERERVQSRMDQLQTEILQLMDQKAQMLSVRNVQDSKLGPVRHVMSLVNPDADPESAVKWIILVLVLVCDPLAVCMLMAANQRVMPKPSDPTATPPLMPVSPFKWDPHTNSLMVQDDNSQWHVLNDQKHAAPEKQLLDDVKLVELTVTELLKQRPIFELAQSPHTHGVRNHVSHGPPSADSQPQMDAHALQKLIEHTLESWMNKTLTVTYSADQKDIDHIVQRVIQQTMQTHPTTPEPDTDHVTPQHVVDPATDIQNPSAHTQVMHMPPEENPVLEQIPPLEQGDLPESTVSHNRPIHNYFGDERIRGGKKHKVTT